MAKEQEGRLTLISLSNFRDLLESGQLEAPADELSPMVLRYFMNIWLQHHPISKIGHEAYRELRTYAEAIDGLLAGRMVGVLDLLMQQFKARTVSLVDGHWNNAKWLQLIPESSGIDTVTSAERDWANRLSEEELKSKERAQKLGGGPAFGGPSG